MGATSPLRMKADCPASVEFTQRMECCMSSSIGAGRKMSHRHSVCVNISRVLSADGCVVCYSQMTTAASAVHSHFSPPEPHEPVHLDRHPDLQQARAARAVPGPPAAER